MNTTALTPTATASRAGVPARRWTALLLSLLLGLAVLPLAPGIAGASTGRQLVVAPGGSDGAPGTAAQPLGSIGHAIRQLQPGDTLVVRGGTYRERVTAGYGSIAPGRSDAPITVRAQAGERPVIEGLLWLSGADHWTVQGINVTWSGANSSNEHMVKFRGGTGWRFTQAEVWGARSYAAVLVSDGARDFRLDNLYVHHTYATNKLNQDHLIYVSTGNRGGMIERNVLAHSPNGRGVKVGPGSLTDPGSDGLTIRHNTFYDNTGPSNIRFSGSSSGNQVYGNLLVAPKADNAAVSAFELTGVGNTVQGNAAWATSSVVKEVAGLLDGGGNVLIDPAFADPARGDFRPTNPAAAAYGAHAPSAAAPSDTVSATAAFVRAVTTDFLSRTATADEVAAWEARVQAGMTRDQVARSFAFSAEWVGVLVDGFYRSTLGRPADAGGRQYWTDRIVGGMTPAAVAAEFYASAEYYSRAGGTAHHWVQDLYRQILHRPADAGGLAFWTGRLAAGTSRSAVAHDFFQSFESRGDRVDGLYRDLLGRAPDGAGRQHWIGVLANGRDVDLAVSLASSAEYLHRAQQRFAG